jgi:23S rRNA pseudouridine1911/1915/1917 synthase
LAAIKLPVLCDKQYGGRAEITRGEIRRDLNDCDVLLSRQALHARRLMLRHPVSGETLTFEAPLADDLSLTLAELREYRRPVRKSER